MSPFTGEAFLIGVKEGIPLYFSVRLVLALSSRQRLDFIRMPLFAGGLVVLLASFAVMAIPVTLEFRDVIVKMIGYVFGLFYLFSLGALYHTTGTDLLGPLKGFLSRKLLLVPLIFLLTLVYFAPDMSGSSLYVADLFSMAGSNVTIFLSAGAGFGMALALSHLIARLVRIDALRLFGLPQVLLVLALMKLMFGGVRGFAELSLIPAVQAGLVKLIHDIVHQTFVFFMVPDHPLLTMTAWKYIGLVFGGTVSLWLSLVVFFLPLGLFIKKHFAEGIAVPAGIGLPARKRIFIKATRDERILKSIPVFLFMLFILSTWFVQTGESIAKLYLPEPLAIIAEKDRVVISLQSPTEDLRDGMLHKFSVTMNNEVVRLLIMKTPDGKLAVCLDACEVCPPEGYGQGKEQVVCIYCNTPIPFDSLGKPGGCNPIPLVALITDKDVQVTLAEIATKRATINSGKGNGGGER